MASDAAIALRGRGRRIISLNINCQLIDLLEWSRARDIMYSNLLGIRPRHLHLATGRSCR